MDRMGNAIDQFLFNNPCLTSCDDHNSQCVWSIASGLTLEHTSHYLSSNNIHGNHHLSGLKKEKKRIAIRIFTDCNTSCPHSYLGKILVSGCITGDHPPDPKCLSLQNEWKAVIRLECAHFELQQKRVCCEKARYAALLGVSDLSLLNERTVREWTRL